MSTVSFKFDSTREQQAMAKMLAESMLKCRHDSVEVNSDTVEIQENTALCLLKDVVKLFEQDCYIVGSDKWSLLHRIKGYLENNAMS